MSPREAARGPRSQRPGAPPYWTRFTGASMGPPVSHPLPPDVAATHAAWAARGRHVTLDEGHRLFVVQEGRGPDLLLVHGFPSTSHDFVHVLPALCERFR